MCTHEAFTREIILVRYLHLMGDQAAAWVRGDVVPSTSVDLNDVNHCLATCLPFFDMLNSGTTPFRTLCLVYHDYVFLTRSADPTFTLAHIRPAPASMMTSSALSRAHARANAATGPPSRDMPRHSERITTSGLHGIASCRRH